MPCDKYFVHIYEYYLYYFILCYMNVALGIFYSVISNF